MARTHHFLVAALTCSGLIWAVHTSEAQTTSRPPTTRLQPRGTSPRSSAPRSSAPRSSAQRGTTQRGTAQRGNTPRPDAEPLRVKKISPQMEQVLVAWEARSSQVNELTGEFSRYTYDRTFFVEKRAEGTFVYRTPDKGLYHVKAKDIPEGSVSRRKSDKNVPYTLVGDTPERWLCTGQEIYQINDEERTYDKVSIPPKHQGENMMDGPLPFLFGMKAEQAKRRYELELMKLTTTEIWISAVPLWQQDRANYQKATIILDRKTFLPKAVQTIDPAGTKETVHTFADVEANPKSLFRMRDPLQVDLKGYKAVIHPDNTQYAEQPRSTTRPQRFQDSPK